MSYSLVGYGAAAPSGAAKSMYTGPQRLVLSIPDSAPPEDSGVPPGTMAAGTISPERCAAAGWHWDEVAQVCLQEAPPEELPPEEPDPTVPPPPGPVPYDPETDCIDAGGCWDPTLAQCLVCDDVGDEPVADEPVIVEPEDNTALYVGLGLLLAVGLAGGYFLISRKKKKKGQPR